MPTITGITGIIEDGNSITISGTAFSTGKSPLAWDNFESGTPGTSISSTPQVGSWTLMADPSPTTHSTAISHSGTQCAYTLDGFGNMAVYGMANYDKIYWSFWFWYYITPGDSDESSQVKVFQLQGNAGYQGCDLTPGVMSGQFAGEKETAWWASYNAASNIDCSTGKVQENYGFVPSESTWHHAEMLLQRSSDYGVYDGTVIINIDGVNIYSHIGTMLTRDYGQDWGRAVFFYSISNDEGHGNWAIDDAYINNSWSRVVIGNNAIYANCTLFDVQPVTSWTSSNITVTVNTGAFNDEDTAYLFVIDENNTPSTSWEITINGESILNISPNNSAQSQESDNITLTPIPYLTVDNSFQIQNSDNITLTSYTENLVINNIQQRQQTDYFNLITAQGVVRISINISIE